MIIEVLLGFFISPILTLIDVLPAPDTSFIDSWSYIRGVLSDILTGVGCLLPIKELKPLVAFQIGVYTFKLVWAVLLRIKSFIPGLGGN